MSGVANTPCINQKLVHNTIRRRRVINKRTRTKNSLLSQNINTIVSFTMGVTDPSIFKTPEQGPTFKNEVRIRMSNKRCIILRVNDISHSFDINFYQQIPDVKVFCQDKALPETPKLYCHGVSETNGFSEASDPRSIVISYKPTSCY